MYVSFDPAIPLEEIYLSGTLKNMQNGMCRKYALHHSVQ